MSWWAGEYGRQDIVYLSEHASPREFDVGNRVEVVSRALFETSSPSAAIPDILPATVLNARPSVFNDRLGSCAMQLSMHNRDYAVRKLITMIAERDAAILERNSAIAERTTAYEERDAALLLRDVAYADRDSAMEERDAAVAALEIAVNNRTLVEKRSSGKDLKLFQTLSMKKNCTLLGAIHPAPFSSTRYSTVVQEQSELCRIGEPKELLGGIPRKRKLLVKPTHDRTVSTKKSCRAPQEHRLELGDGDEAEYCKGSNDEVHIGNVRYPIPHCSCTGVRQQCYRWGNGGWQSSCCTTMISMYPLPMNPTKRGSRLAGRKMSAGAFEKLLEKLGSEGVNVSHPVDLKDHWAKHGTNRYVTLR